MPDVVYQYQEILTADESVASLDAAARLAVRVASGGKRRWVDLLQAEQSPPHPATRSAAAARRAREVVWLLSSVSKQLDHCREDVPEDQYSLLMDTLLLVFHQAYFALLPKAAREREALLQAFADLSTALPRPQDRFQIMGLVQIERADFDAAADSFRAALAATHSDEHDFMTRLQMLWTVLMERARYQEAFDCLLDIYPRASRNDLPEIAALLRQVFLDSRAQGDQPASATRGNGRKARGSRRCAS
jgi:hypothetical protein